ncbi:MAG: FGGY family carbohydrate kinase [Thermoproteota archaeon]
MEAGATFILGVDLGTSACKTVVFTLDGRRVASASREYPVIQPQPRWAEQNPLEWWRAAVETIRESLAKRRIEGSRIVGLAVDSQREAVVPVGANGEVLYNSIIWLDRRTEEQTERMRSLLDESMVLRTTGVGINPVFSASKILWLKENFPNIFSKTKVFLFAKDFIIYKLTGEKITDYSMASRTMLFDIRRRKWAEEICSTLGIPVDKLPPPCESSIIVGEVSSNASVETSLPRGLPVVNGGGDRPCECLGAGVIKEGAVNIGTGTGSTFEAPLSRPNPDLRGRVNCCCHVIPGAWEYESSISTTGGALRWFKNVFGERESKEAEETGGDPYDLIIRGALETNLGADGLLFYPYLAGAFPPRVDGKARAVFFGINLSHSKGHFVRAILEGVAFHYLTVLELLRELGLEIAEVSMVGGETRSDFWNQLKADVTGRRIRIPEVEDAAAMGAAILAGIGTGQYTSVQKAVESTVRTRRVYVPNAENHSAYLKLYEKYEAIYALISKAYDVY